MIQKTKINKEAALFQPFERFFTNIAFAVSTEGLATQHVKHLRELTANIQDDGV